MSTERELERADADKEALERLKEAATTDEVRAATVITADLRALIAKQEGLEREVMRLRAVGCVPTNGALKELRDELSAEFEALPDGEYVTFSLGFLRRLAQHKCGSEGGLSYQTTRAEAAESKLSALSDKAENVCIAHGMAWDMEGVIGELRALLDPAVPVEAKAGFGWKLSDEGKAALDALDQAQAAGVMAVLEHPEHFVVGAALPVQDVAGLSALDAERLDSILIEAAREPSFSHWEGMAETLAAIKRAALSPVPPSQGAAPNVVHHHNIHPWAQPGDRPDRWWRLRFDDQDMREMIWSGPDAEREARAAYAQYSPAWNCYLFATVEARAQAHPDVAGLVEALRKIEASSMQGSWFWNVAHDALAAFQSRQDERS